MMIHNKHLWPFCRKYGWRPWCLREEFLDNLCSLFPIQLMKVTRASLSVVSDLLQDSRLKDLKLLFLLRDPRAVMHSRSGYEWCQESKDCREPSILCQHLEQDFETMSQLQADFPNRIMYLRYEDFAAKPKSEILHAINFLGLKHTEAMERMIEKRIDKNGKLIAHSADTSSNVWQSQMAYEKINEVQESCTKAMALWGYKVFEYEDIHPNRAVLPIDILPKIIDTNFVKNQDSDEFS